MKKKVIHDRKGKAQPPITPIKVFWWMEGKPNELHSSWLHDVVEGRAVFKDGGWNPLTHCFLSEKQARTFKPPLTIDSLSQEVKLISSQIMEMADGLQRLAVNLERE